MNEHNKLKPVETMNYCRGNLEKNCDHKTNCKCKPLMIIDVETKKFRTMRKWKMDVFDKNGKPIRIQCEFGNSRGKAKASGARAVLEIRK